MTTHDSPDADAPPDAELAAALEAVRGDLAALAAQSVPMPADVVARLDAALANAGEDSRPGERTGAVTLLPAARAARAARWRSGWASGVAASVVALLVVAVAVGALTHKKSATTSASRSGALAGGPKFADSERDYTPDTLTGGVLDLLAGRLAPAPAGAPQAATGTGAVSATSPSHAAGTFNDKQAPGSSALSIDPGCLSALTGGPGVTPNGIDVARWQGQPAFVVVVPISRIKLGVFVVARSCSAHDQKLLYFVRIPRP